MEKKAITDPNSIAPGGPRDLPETMTAYLRILTNELRRVLGLNLLGVYLQGSASQGDFRSGTSDLDVMVVTHSAITDSQKEELKSKFDHKNHPVPAAGLDLMILSAEAARRPTRKPSYEFWISTGANWELSVEEAGQTSEVLIFLAACRGGAHTLSGPESKVLFSQPPYKLILAALIDIMEWHKTMALDEFHDPNGQNSVLNASRAWMYAVDRVMGSKAKGGEWVLNREPDNELVRGALKIRDGASGLALSHSFVEAYLNRVTAIILQRRSANGYADIEKPLSSGP